MLGDANKRRKRITWWSQRRQARPDGSPPAHGVVPEDIPVGDDDDLLQAQIRAAAMAEPDPKLRTKLWNEYRKYKGLPAEKP